MSPRFPARVLALVALASVARSQPDDPAPAPRRSFDLESAHSPGEILYALRGPAYASSRLAIRELVDATTEETLWPGEIYRLVLPENADLEAALRRLNADPRVRYAEPNYTRSADLHPDDPSLASQWGLEQANDADIDAPEAWDLRTSAANVVVGVIDTGVDLQHSDLVANLWTNPGEIPGNGLDDDQNGWVDDVHGIDTVNEDGDPDDDHGHGTHVAGILGADTDNALGVAGACWEVQVMALKFLNASGTGSTANAIRCLDYAVQMGARLTNNSWGSSGGYSQALKDAIELAGAAGQLFCCSAGNSGVDLEVFPAYPASYDSANLVAVAASDQNDKRSPFSNYGALSVDLAAPGSGILSTWPGDQYSSQTGTSMSAAFVTGVAAMLYAESGTNDPQAVKGWLLGSVDVLGAWSGRVVSDGRLNFAQALASAQGGSGGNNRPPLANAGPDQLGEAGAALTFDGSGSSDPDGDPLSFTWDFGDGTPTESGEVVTHAYPVAGTYVVVLSVDDGQDSDQDTAVVTVTNPPSGELLYLSLSNDQTYFGVAVSDEDVVALDLGSGGFATVLDLSDVGVTTDLDAFAVLPTGEFLMSFETALDIPGLIGGPDGERVEPADIVRFVPTQLGPQTAGTFTFYFDGSDVELSATSEGIDAIALDFDGALVISTVGALRTSEHSAADEDLSVFVASSLGETTAGSFLLLFDGSDVALTKAGEDIDSAFVTPGYGILLSTRGNYSVHALSGTDDDVLLFQPDSLGSLTVGKFSLFLDGAAYGLTSNDIDGVSLPPGQ